MDRCASETRAGLRSPLALGSMARLFCVDRHDAVDRKPRRERLCLLRMLMNGGQAADFLRISGLFVLGLALVLAACEAGLTRWTTRERAVHHIGGEVGIALRHAKLRSNSVKAVYLGDS